MKVFYRFWFLSILLLPFTAQAQTMTLTGRVLDQTTQAPIPAASIRIKNSVIGTVTNANGAFTLRTTLSLPLTLFVSSVGYQTIEQTISSGNDLLLHLLPQAVQANEVVISASRREEKSLESPITIEQLDQKAIRETPAPTFFEALESVKGIQMTTASLGFKVPNTRGFTNPTNVRFLQLVDGVDNQAPVIGAAIANGFGPTELDIERVEVIPGTASALYGMNSLNGLVNFFTKNPFDYQGLSAYQRTGINHLNNPEEKSHIFSETAFRYAKAVQNRLAIKVNLNYTRGYDWIAHQTTDLNPNANASVNLIGAENPALDPVSSYGNESPNRRTLSLNGKNYVVARTGYYEKDITDYRLQNLKMDGALHYRFTNQMVAAYQYKFSNLDNVYQRTNRFKLDNYQLSQQVFQVKSPDWQFKAYYTREVSGKSYNIRSLAENLDKKFKSDDQWFSEYQKNFLANQANGLGLAQSHGLARSLTDQGRFEPGTAAYDQALAHIISINNWDVGAALRTKASLFQAEGQYDWSSRVKWFNLLVGFDYRLYSVFPDGNYFINPQEPGNNVLYRKGGGFAQLSKKLFKEKLHLNAALRYDKNEYFKGIFNPRVSAVYSLPKDQYLRASFQNGYRFPSLFEAFSNVNSGGVKRVGGLPVMSQGIFENSFIRSSIDAFQAAVNKDVNQGGTSLSEAITNRAGLLKKSAYDYIQPERINSLELGYKGLFFNSRLFLDGDVYFNFYDHFIAQVEVNQVNRQNVPPDSIKFFLYDKKKQDRYRLWTNSTGTVYNYGSSLGVKYNFYKQFSLGSNVSYAKLYRKKFNDGLEEAFNTPSWITNISLGNPTLVKNVGFQINWHWQDSFLWQSSLGTGIVPAYQTLDAQLSYKAGALNQHWPAKLLIKVGGTNVLNNQYYQMVAGPTIGAMYYVTLVLEDLL